MELKDGGCKSRGKIWLAILCLFAILTGAAGSANGAEIKFRVTAGAGVRAFTKGEAHFIAFTEHPLTKGENEGDYETYTGSVPDGSRFHYIAGGGDSGFLKTAKVVYLNANETTKTITIDVENLDSSRREDNGFRADDVYLNVNDAQHLLLNAGETFRLIPIRVWQAMEGFTDNYFIEPDYKVEVLGDAGTVGSKWDGSPGLEYAELSALKPGVAVLRVTYGPLRFDFEDGESSYANAIAPVNTGIVVVTVVEGNNKSSGVATNITAREYDTIYFDRGQTDHAEYSFKPSGAGDLSVRVHRPVHGGAAWGAGWGGGVKNADGSFTVNLYEGRNVVEIGGGAYKEYHVINAKGATIGIANAARPGSAPKAGDRLEISFDGIKTPLEKIAGIYNPGFPDTCYVSYKTPDGDEARSEGLQYNLSERNTITVTVPRSGKVELTGGVIDCGHMGDPLGSHRTRPGNEPVYPNLNAKSLSGSYSALPDITIGATDGGENPGEGGGGGCDAGAGVLGAFALALIAFFMKKIGHRRSM
jgi:hypothetical protein